MAIVTLHDDRRTIEGDERVATFLSQYNIDCGRWDLSSIPADLLARNTLTPEEKAQVLEALGPRIELEKARFGYQSADVVSLSADIPNLEKILEPFRREHYHVENEIRLVIDGHGVFSINPRTAPAFDVAMDPGDFISVPAGTWHWFNLGPDQRIKAVRIFESAEGWAAIYPDEVASAATV